MIQGLKQFVPSEICLSCDACCRFKESKSPWRPKITKEEIDGMKNPDLLSVIYSKEKIEKSGHIKTKKCGDNHHLCSFFAPETNACTIYELRPFECQLYPFVLTKVKNEVAVVVHHHCPFVQENRNTSEFQKYAEYLQQFFRREDTLQFIKRNPSLAGEYPAYEGELEYLFTVC